MLETGQLAYLPLTAVRIARSLVTQGRADEAARILETAKAEVWDDGEAFQLMWRGTLARIRAQQGDTRAALLELGKAEQIAARTDYLLRLAKAHLARAEVLSIASRTAEARVSAAEALRLFEYKGDLASAGQARGFSATFL